MTLHCNGISHWLTPYPEWFLQWHHITVLVPHTTDNSIVCSTVCSGKYLRCQNFAILALWWGNPPVTGGFPSQRASNACHDIVKNVPSLPGVELAPLRLLRLLEPQTFQLGRTRNKTDIATFLDQPAYPPVIVELLQGQPQRSRLVQHIHGIKMKHAPSSLTHIYASVNLPSLVQIMACRLVGAKPLSKPMLGYR